MQFSTVRIEEKNWKLGIVTEAGVFVPFSGIANEGVLINIKYNEVFYNVQNIDNMRYLNYNVGIAFKY